MQRSARQLAPDLIAISGDLTQRAREREFVQAQAFLHTLPDPKIVVPGNHDVPLYNIVARFLAPLERYKRIVSMETEPLVRGRRDDSRRRQYRTLTGV